MCNVSHSLQATHEDTGIQIWCNVFRIPLTKSTPPPSWIKKKQSCKTAQNFCNVTSWVTEEVFYTKTESGSTSSDPEHWQIQDFREEGAPTYYFDQIFLKIAWKWIKLDANAEEKKMNVNCVW